MPKLKQIQDYYELICSEYPTISLSDIKRILQYGFKSLFFHNYHGGDTLINRKGFWFYCGLLMNDSLKYFEYYKRKMRIKLHIMYKRKKIPWDGYYYFALTLNLYDEYLKLKNKKGRPKKKFTFSKIILYKLFDECNIIENNRIAIFKIPLLSELGFSFYKPELTTDKAELILVRKPLKFLDILLTNYKYQFISNNLKYKTKEYELNVC